jgi:AcrR family transcriptional regulator
VNDRRADRHARTAQLIVDAAWRLASEHGLAGITLRDVAREVGMRAPSLYVYFDSKAAIYDAMFVEGNHQLLNRQRAWAASEPPDLHGAARSFVSFCTENPIRYQLLFQRVIPGWQPSPDAYASALAVYEHMTQALARVGIQGARALDLWTALLTGLTDQQISNDPGGDRWTSLVDDAVDMLLAHLETKASG